MPTVSFLGKVFPSGVVKLTWSIPYPVRWPVEKIGATIFRINIENSEVRVDCEIPKYDPDEVKYLLVPAIELTECLVDLAAFSSGYGWLMFLDTFVDPEGNTGPIGYVHHELSAECTAYKAITTTQEDRDALAKIINLVFAIDRGLMYALKDLIEAVTRPNVSPINCGRVMDGLRKIAAPSLAPAAGWRVLQGIVNCDEKYQRFVTDLSTNPRHGDRTMIAGDIAAEAVKRTWIVMNRFLEYRKRGNQPLPLNEFPRLQG
jgi:hypothetical protein